MICKYVIELSYCLGCDFNNAIGKPNPISNSN